MEAGRSSPCCVIQVSRQSLNFGKPLLSREFGFPRPTWLRTQNFRATLDLLLTTGLCLSHSQPPETTMELGGRRPARCNSCDYMELQLRLSVNLSLDRWALGAVRIFSLNKATQRPPSFYGANRHVTKLRTMPLLILTPTTARSMGLLDECNWS